MDTCRLCLQAGRHQQPLLLAATAALSQAWSPSLPCQKLCHHQQASQGFQQLVLLAVKGLCVPQLRLQQLHRRLVTQEVQRQARPAAAALQG
jgi:hypothetical protein